MAPLTRDEIETGLASGGLDGARAVFHSSLRSFGNVAGGADAVVDAIRAVCATVLMPAFSFDSNAPPPPGERPDCNGCDYGFYEGWTKPAIPFRLEAARPDAKMGSIARTFAARRDAVRSDHPWHSWAAAGPMASEIINPHPWETTNLPLERLAAHGASVVLVGVGLTACTAVHVAEERAGRRPFIRWATDRDGRVRAVRAAGCSKGFAALESLTDDLFTDVTIGHSRVRIASLAALIDRCADIMRSQPGITVCSETCLRCRDSVRGGPREITAR